MPVEGIVTPICVHGMSDNVLINNALQPGMVTPDGIYIRSSSDGRALYVVPNSEGTGSFFDVSRKMRTEPNKDKRLPTAEEMADICQLFQANSDTVHLEEKCDYMTSTPVHGADMVVAAFMEQGGNLVTHGLSKSDKKAHYMLVCTKPV